MKGEIDFSTRTQAIGRRADARWKRVGFAGVVAFAVICWMLASLCSTDEVEVKVGAWAKYKMLSTYTYGGEKPPLETVTLRMGPTEARGEETYRWWQMECEKTGGGSFSITVLSKGVPILPGTSYTGDVARYILKEGEEGAIEFTNAEDGKPLPLPFSWMRLTPHRHWTASLMGPFPAQGILLGQMLALWEWSNEGEFPPLGEPLVLKLDPGLLIGTGRNFRDTLDHRITGGEDYPYRRFTKEEYDEMIEAGINYFTVDPEQAEWIRRRPVFCEQGNLKGVRLPEILYRSNYMGAVQFVDEPACYIYGDADAKKGAKRPSDLAALLRLRVARTVWGREGSYASRHLDHALREAGFNLGDITIVEDDIPIWETLIQTSWYQLWSGAASGIIHEGRYQLDSFHANLKRIGLESDWLGAKEMLLFHYAFLRGAARAWGKNWGMSIYGQADPKISPLAVTLAYDLGARYIWYWTSDHGHHLPYREQLELTRHLRAHEKAHPRKSREELLEAAKVAIAIPQGYVVDFSLLWGSSEFAHDKLNEAGVPYGEVVKAAVKEALACLKKDESFDFVVDALDFEQSGYERVVHVHLDGTVKTEKTGSGNQK